MSVSLRAFCGVAVLVLRTPSALAAAPDWLLAEARRSVPPGLATGSSAVVLRVETRIDIAADGRVEMHERKVVKILTVGGREKALARVVYAPDSERVRELRGWLVQSDGEVRALEKRDVVDAALSPGDVYNEARVRVLSAPADALPGAVLGFETTLEAAAGIPETEWRPADRLPLVEARLALKAAEGVRVRWAQLVGTFAEAVQPDGARTFTIRDVAATPEEAWAPPVSSLVPWLGLSWSIGSADAPTWAGVSTWLASLVDGPAAPTPDVVARARALAGGDDTLSARVEALSRFVQRLPYVSIQTGVGRGGGLRPRLAARVLAQGYGDCKDKATLLRALLAGVGVETYFVAASLGDRSAVRAEWPWTLAFDHAIVAMRANGLPAGRAVLEHPQLGPLLLFDPTDAGTPFGELQAALQGGLALVVGPGSAQVVRLPNEASDGHRLEQALEGTLSAGGGFSGELLEKATGAVAAGLRRQRLTSTAAVLERDSRDWVAAVLPGARVVSVTSGPNGSTEETRARVEIPRFVQAAGTLGVVPVSPIGYERFLPRIGATRATPVEIPPRVLVSTVTLDLPETFSIDEAPPPAAIESAWGSLRSTSNTEGRRLLVRHELRTVGSRVPVGELPKLRTFLEAAYRVLEAPAVVRSR